MTGVEQKLNILMVDDQPGKLLSYEVILSELGENLIKANSGREALDHLLRTNIAVVLMDVSMPELDGFEIADMIREHPRFQNTAIIFISAVRLSDFDRLRAYERGAVDYISVPVVPELLRAKVSVFTELHRKRHQMESLNQELRVLSARLLAAQDDERRRIARELHDGLGQELSAVKIMTDGLARPNQAAGSIQQTAKDCSAILDHAIQQIRTMSHLLHPPLLDEIGLQSAVQHYLRGLTDRSGIKASLRTDPATFPRLNPETETTIFRVVQEALTNVVRHSGAAQADVALVRSDGHITLSITDDGKGMSRETLQFQPGSVGIGIAGMRQRIKELGGQVRLENKEPGCLVEITIPINEEVFAAPAL
jgi:signal transduction histidine kinase